MIKVFDNARSGEGFSFGRGSVLSEGCRPQVAWGWGLFPHPKISDLLKLRSQKTLRVFSNSVLSERRFSYLSFGQSRPVHRTPPALCAPPVPGGRAVNGDRPCREAEGIIQVFPVLAPCGSGSQGTPVLYRWLESKVQSGDCPNMNQALIADRMKAKTLENKRGSQKELLWMRPIIVEDVIEQLEKGAHE